jgi:hypothetical protein
MVLIINLISGRMEGFEGFSVKEFNTHFEMCLAVKKDEFAMGEIVGFISLVIFSVKAPA